MVGILLLAAYLRIYRLGVIPYGLIPDEVMRGYDAYSLWQTGADSFGAFLPLFLRGFDDYTPALYSYLSVPFVAIFGLSAQSVRLASAVAGLVTVALTYQLGRQTFGRAAGLTAALLLAISPWHILASRTGAEWNLLALGPVLTITLAYRGWQRPNLLIAAGAAAGISLYGYAPIKIFLPLLLGGFFIFYRAELSNRKTSALLAAGVLGVMALPIYIFSFTPQGMQRFSIVYEGSQMRLLETIPRLVGNYFSYFSPKFFILSEYDDPALPIYVAHLKSVGLLSWFELVLIGVGSLGAIFSKRKKAWFILYWLVVSPLGINLHSNSPWPTLWLTAIPAPQVLAGAGLAYLLAHARGKWLPAPFATRPRLRQGLKIATMVLVAGLGAGIFANFGAMHEDLFYQYPVYGAKDGRKEAIVRLLELKEQYDQTIIPATNLSTSIYLLFYTRYDPAQRQAELAEFPQETWQKIDGYKIGPVENFVGRPGCHLILTSVAHSRLIRSQLPRLMTIQEFYLPTGEPNVGLYALPAPPPEMVNNGTTFGGDIALQSYGLVATSGSTTNLRPNNAICLVLQWQALKSVDKNYTFFLHLTGPYGPHGSPKLVAQVDSFPLHGARPTSTWAAGETVFDLRRLVIPDQIPAGVYRLEAGWYDSSTGERLLINSPPDDKLTLLELTVQPKR